MGPLGRRAQALFSVGFVFRPAALKENNLTVAFKGQDMGGNAVQEPAVVADHHGTAAEIFQGVLQRSQGVDVQGNSGTLLTELTNYYRYTSKIEGPLSSFSYLP